MSQRALKQQDSNNKRLISGLHSKGIERIHTTFAEALAKPSNKSDSTEVPIVNPGALPSLRQTLLGTIHILPILYITLAQNLILTTYFLHKNSFFFVKTEDLIFQHYILTKCSFCSLKLLVDIKKKMFKKFAKM